MAKAPVKAIGTKSMTGLPVNVVKSKIQEQAKIKKKAAMEKRAAEKALAEEETDYPRPQGMDPNELLDNDLELKSPPSMYGATGGSGSSKYVSIKSLEAKDAQI